MRMLIQKVKQAKVIVDGKVVGAIHQGLCVFVGFSKQENPSSIPKWVDKLLGLRIFPNAEGKMHYNVLDAQGEILVVSQFTLYAQMDGRRPSFTESMPSSEAKKIYDDFLQELTIQIKRHHTESKIATGVFGAHMEVDLINDGPLTFWLDMDES